MVASAVFAWKLGKQQQELHADSITIGTRLPAQLVLDDPIASDAHCRIECRGRSFVLVAGESATGTYVGGILVDDERPLSVGDRLVLGVSHVEVTEIDPQVPRIELAVTERSFYFTAKTREQFQSDADEWVRSEVRFGRFMALRRANWIVGVAAFVLALGAFLFGNESAAVQPGPLSDAHHWIFDGDESAFEERLEAHRRAGAAFDVAATRAGRAQGCAACHTPFGGVDSDSCSTCHTELGLTTVLASDALPDHPRHPFLVEGSIGCAACHREHGGGSVPTAPESERTSAGCDACHAHPDGGALPEEPLAAFDLLASSGLALAPEQDARVYVADPNSGYGRFRHGVHAAQPNNLDCDDCHTRTVDGELARPTFETCAACHVAASGDDLARHVVVMDVERHGSGADGMRCEQCHTEAFAPAMRTVDVLDLGDEPLEFRLTYRSHDDELDTALSADALGGHGGGRSCTECHRSGSIVGPGRDAREAAFSHAEHLTFTSPEAFTSPRDAATALAQCGHCHPGFAGEHARDDWNGAAVTALVAAPNVFDVELEACAACHTDGTSALVERAHGDLTSIARPRGGEPAVAFDHSLHTNVDGGCFACHVLEDEGGARLDRPHTLASAANCTLCHIDTDAGGGLTHANIGGATIHAGGAGCSFCHPGDPNAGEPRLNAVFRTPPRERTDTHSSFSHATAGHMSLSCTDCHGSIDTRSDEVKLPSPTAAVCRECHFETRYHWR